MPGLLIRVLILGIRGLIGRFRDLVMGGEFVASSRLVDGSDVDADDA